MTRQVQEEEILLGSYQLPVMVAEHMVAFGVPMSIFASGPGQFYVHVGLGVES